MANLKSTRDQTPENPASQKRTSHSYPQRESVKGKGCLDWAVCHPLPASAIPTPELTPSTGFVSQIGEHAKHAAPPHRLVASPDTGPSPYAAAPGRKRRLRPTGLVFFMKFEEPFLGLVGEAPRKETARAWMDSSISTLPTHFRHLWGGHPGDHFQWTLWVPWQRWEFSAGPSGGFQLGWRSFQLPPALRRDIQPSLSPFSGAQTPARNKPPAPKLA